MLVGIRPEKLNLHVNKPEQDSGIIEGIVENISYLGERSHYYVKIDGLSKSVSVSSQNVNRAQINQLINVMFVILKCVILVQMVLKLILKLTLVIFIKDGVIMKSLQK